MKKFRLAAIALAFAGLGACAPSGGPSVGTSASSTPGQTTVAGRAVGLSDTLPRMRSFRAAAAPAPARPNAEIAADFLDLAFRMESGRAVPVMTRFEGPIGVRVDGALGPASMADLEGLISRLRREAGIDIFLTRNPDAAITVVAIPKAQLHRAVPGAACFVVPRVSSWAEFRHARRGGALDWTTLTRRDKAAIFIPADAAPQEIRDCMHEELAQALGPLNDLYRLPDSVFNDDNIHAVLTGFDMLVLRAYYDPALRNGMTRGEVAVRLPAILARLNPAGERGVARPRNDTSRDWVVAIETALTGSNAPGARRQAAERAVNLSRAFAWDGPRRGFAHYAYGRLQVGYAPDLALAAFREAYRTYASDPDTALHAAHVAVQIAAFTLSSGDAAGTIEIVDRALPVAARHQNAALMATLMMFKAEALELQGRGEEAQVVRLDSLGWARYGFGSDEAVRARLREVQALSPI